MLVGLLQIELFIPESGSLKGKRFLLKSIKTRIHNKFNVSVAEVDENEKWQRTTLGIALVANERKFIDQVMSEVIRLIETEDEVEIIRQQLEIV
ncbi:MAG TPA: DUF503 domain-containing protein [bacterium]|nr:DUF503 domain-containing protein [bacterium]HOY43362.1 DUF503 domain-containing protein [bacterium]HPG82511.1 DUF503 domain-containing protein [bacterium]HPM59070.1 DUF503 domain-containing protein [bacterium]